MSVLNRKLFNRGGQVSSRGVGITSGLTPVRGYANGGEIYRAGANNPTLDQMANRNVTNRAIDSFDATMDLLAIQNAVAAAQNEADQNKPPKDEFQSNFDKNLALLKGVQGEKQPFNRFEAAAPALMTMFGEWMSGTSYQGGLGGALEIAGRGVSKAAPQFSEAIKARREYEQGTDDSDLRTKALELTLDQQKVEDRPMEKDINGVLRYVDTKEKVFPGVSKIEDEKSRPMKKGTDGRWHYTDGEKELVFPDLAEEAKADEAVKGIPRDIFDSLEDSQKLEVLNLGAKGDDIKGVKITNVDGNQVMTWLENGDPKKQILGKAPSEEKEAGALEERAIEGMIGMIGQPKAMYQAVIEQYGQVSTGDIITQEDVEMFMQKATNSLAILKSTDAKNISPQDQANISLNEMLLEKVITPDIEKIIAGGETAVGRKTIVKGIREALEGDFEPGFAVGPRLTIGKAIDLLSPENLPESLKKAMSALRIGNPVAGDVLEKLTARLTISTAEGGAIPGNLNAKEFEELKNAGIPLWTTKEGMLIMADIYEREADVNIAADNMLKQISSQQREGMEIGDKFLITLPDGSSQDYDSFDKALQAIKTFRIQEGSNIYTGSDMMGTDDLSSRISQLGRYDKDSLLLKGGVVRWGGSEQDALEAQEEGRLFFSHFGDADNPNPKHRNKAVYLYDTGELWAEDDKGYNPEIHDLNTPKFIYWAKVK
jgi:hypothetical protein